MRNIRRQFAAELRKYYLEVKCYYPDHIVNLVVLFIMFSGFFKLFTNSDVIPDSAYYIGFVYWFYANGIIGESSVSISTEKQSGTFEQLLIKPSSLSSILFYRSACWLLFQSAEIAVVMLALHMILSVPMSFSLLFWCCGRSGGTGRGILSASFVPGNRYFTPDYFKIRRYSFGYRIIGVQHHCLSASGHCSIP